jgi:hypothetical protein
MSNKLLFQSQFMDIDPQKLIRRQRFIRRMQYRVYHRIDKRQTRKMLKNRATKLNLL